MLLIKNYMYIHYAFEFHQVAYKIHFIGQFVVAELVESIVGCVVCVVTM